MNGKPPTPKRGALPTPKDALDKALRYTPDHNFFVREIRQLLCLEQSSFALVTEARTPRARYFGTYGSDDAEFHRKIWASGKNVGTRIADGDRIGGWRQDVESDGRAAFPEHWPNRWLGGRRCYLVAHRRVRDGYGYHKCLGCLPWEALPQCKSLTRRIQRVGSEKNLRLHHSGTILRSNLKA
jgi:hypothetical protein